MSNTMALRMSELEGKLKRSYSRPCVGLMLVLGLLVGVCLGQVSFYYRTPVVSMTRTASARHTAEHAPIHNNPMWWCPESQNKWDQAVAVGNKDDLIVEVGSFDGVMAILYARQGFKVVTFEPTPTKAEKIRQKIVTENLETLIDFRQEAVGNYTGEVDMYISGGAEGAGSEQDMVGKPPSGWTTLEPVKVPIVTLDDAIGDREVMFMSIDAQGHDTEVIQGGKRLFESGRVRVFGIEVSPGLGDIDAYVSMFDWLYSVGYVCGDCKDMGRAWLQFVDIKELHQGLHEVDEVLKNYRNAEYVISGNDIGTWTDFVCWRRDLVFNPLTQR